MTASGTEARTILYIDSDRYARPAFVSGLRGLGYTVIETGNAEDALATLESSHPDIILCEESLPGMSSAALLRSIRGDFGTLDATPFLLMSASSDRRHALSLRALGADDVLLKPIDLDTVSVILQACLAQVKRLQRGRHSPLKRDEPSRVDRHSIDVEVSFSSLAGALDGMSRGVIYLDCSGNIRNMNRTAETILSESGFLKAVAGRLRVPQASSARALKDAIRAATADQPSASIVPIPRETQAPLVLHVCPLETGAHIALPAVAVVIVDPSVPAALSAPVIAKIYGLTRSESRIAVALTGGKKLDEIAGQFGVSAATVAFHIQNLFRKTRTARQSELIALLLRSSISTPVLQIAA